MTWKKWTEFLQENNIMEELPGYVAHKKFVIKFPIEHSVLGFFADSVSTASVVRLEHLVFPLYQVRSHLSLTYSCEKEFDLSQDHELVAQSVKRYMVSKSKALEKYRKIGSLAKWPIWDRTNWWHFDMAAEDIFIGRLSKARIELNRFIRSFKDDSESRSRFQEYATQVLDALTVSREQAISLLKRTREENLERLELLEYATDV